MIKKVLVVVLVVFTTISYAQDGTISPYSFYGLGLQNFKGTVENRSMGGLGILTDSIHLNLQNPAAYGGLKLTTYSVGVNYNGLDLNNAQGETSYKDNASLDYLSIGIPAGKFGFGFGVIPVNAVGYKVNDFDEQGNETRFFGSGGLNKVYVSGGVQLNENLSLGLDFNYNFGNIENKSILDKPNVEFDTRSINDTNLSGVSFSVGLAYKRMITDKLELSTSVVSRPRSKLAADNSLELATIQVESTGQEIIIERQDVPQEDETFYLPAEFKVGAGIGQPKKWFLGAEYTYLDADDLSVRSFAGEQATYQTASQFGLGGYYIPNYVSLTNYFSRVVYRAGFRYQETGLNVNGQDINEFGISFGLGLPVGGLFSNANLGFEYGERGTTDMGLVKENFFNLSLSLSLNDRWFKKLKFN